MVHKGIFERKKNLRLYWGCSPSANSICVLHAAGWRIPTRITSGHLWTQKHLQRVTVCVLRDSSACLIGIVQQKGLNAQRTQTCQPSKRIAVSNQWVSQTHIHWCLKDPLIPDLPEPGGHSINTYTHWPWDLYITHYSAKTHVPFYIRILYNILQIVVHKMFNLYKNIFLEYEFVK